MQAIGTCKGEAWGDKTKDSFSVSHPETSTMRESERATAGRNLVEVHDGGSNIKTGDSFRIKS